MLRTLPIDDDIICKDCKNNIGDTSYSNDYHKAYCAVYEYPESKPAGILLKSSKCQFYEK